MNDTTVREKLRDIAMGLMDVIDAMPSAELSSQEKAKFFREPAPRPPGLRDAEPMIGTTSGATSEVAPVSQEKIMRHIIERLGMEVNRSADNRWHLRSILQRFSNDALPADKPAVVAQEDKEKEELLILPALIYLLDCLEDNNNSIQAYLNSFEDIV